MILESMTVNKYSSFFFISLEIFRNHFLSVMSEITFHIKLAIKLSLMHIELFLFSKLEK